MYKVFINESFELLGIAIFIELALLEFALELDLVLGLTDSAEDDPRGGDPEVVLADIALMADFGATVADDGLEVGEVSTEYLIGKMITRSTLFP